MQFESSRPGPRLVGVRPELGGQRGVPIGPHGSSRPAGAGAGTALVRHVHREPDRAGFNATLLHYLGMSPLAGPFWHRCGYRPLTTNWEVRPASQLR